MIGRAETTLRRLSTRQDYVACVALQHEIWGEAFVERVPATLLKVCQRVGGVALGGFDESDRLLGFVFGISGVRDGRLAHWSDMLAVHPDARGSGLGVRLKERQRQQLLADGIELVCWSFDPLVARNANLNLNRLGATAVEYVVDMYGNTGSPLHRGNPTDRLIVEWRLNERRVIEALERRAQPLPPAAGNAPLVGLPTDTDANFGDLLADLPDGPLVRLAIPSGAASRLATDADAGVWRRRTRQAFQHYLHHGFEVLGFTSGDDAEFPWYTLVKPDLHAR